MITILNFPCNHFGIIKSSQSDEYLECLSFINRLQQIMPENI
jgi:hypothetical protein